MEPGILEPIKYVPISYTYIVYDKESLLSKAMAYSSLIPIFLVVSYATVILARRELHTMFMFAGQLICEALNLFLKAIIKEPRPSSASIHQKHGYGMPSDHAQFMFFFAAYVILFVHFSAKFELKYSPLLISLGTFALSSLIAFSRIYLGLHTATQVFAGAIIGLIFGTCWFFVVRFGFSKLFPWIEQLSISKFFYIKDSSQVENVVKFEYETSRKHRKKKD